MLSAVFGEGGRMRRSLLAVALFAQRFNTQLAGLLLVAGVLVAIVVALSGPARARARK